MEVILHLMQSITAHSVPETGLIVTIAMRGHVPVWDSSHGPHPSSRDAHAGLGRRDYKTWIMCYTKMVKCSDALDAIVQLNKQRGYTNNRLQEVFKRR